LPSTEKTEIFTRPRLGFLEVGVHLLRALPLMALVFLPIAAIGIWGALQLETTYTAQTRVLVSLSEEFIFRPRVGEGVPNNVPEREALTSTEIDLMYSPVVLERVIEELGLERLYPDAAVELAEAPEHLKYEKSQAGLVALQQNFSAYSAPKQAVIFANFKHADPSIAAEVLNAIVDTYLEYRAEVFQDKSPLSLSIQRSQFEDNLSQVEEDMSEFLTTNQIGDFEAERSTTQALFANIEEALFTNSARQTELDGQLFLLQQQLENTAPELDIFVEDNTAQAVVALELERQELLTRYQPGSQIVQDINQRIERARAYVNSEGRPSGTVRRGPNPLYQNIETQPSTD